METEICFTKVLVGSDRPPNIKFGKIVYRTVPKLVLPVPSTSTYEMWFISRFDVNAVSLCALPDESNLYLTVYQ